MNGRASNMCSSRSPSMRRPFDSATYEMKTYFESNNTSSSTNFESDVFSYDHGEPTHWDCSNDLAKNLPEDLGDAILYWQCAAAAVSSGLARIAQLDSESLYRGWPDEASTDHKPMPPLSLRAPIMPGADTPPDSPRPTTTSPPPKSRYDASDPVAPAHATISGIESPPYTPTGTYAAATPIRSCDGTDPGVDQIGRLSRNRRDSVVLDGPRFHEASWETFVASFKAEIQVMRDTTWPRLKSCTRRVGSPGMRRRLRGAVREEFEDWWHACETKCYDDMLEVMALETPDLELVKLERAAKGLSV